MKSIRLSSLAGLAVFVACCCLHSAAHAQATRTWVSGVGDDANPGSRTAPCKTFTGDLGKTIAGGEMDVLDPGEFSPVTIAKAVTIDGNGQVAGIQASNGAVNITVQAGASDVVTLRNLSISGVGSGGYGVRITSGSVVRIENCIIFGSATNGIDFQPTTANAKLIVVNSHIYDCLGAGIYVKPAAGGTVAIVHTVIEHCGAGINAAAGTATLMESTIAGNTGAGLATSGAGAITTYHNNEIFGNNPDGSATGSLPLR